MAYSTQSAVSDGTLSVLPLSIDYLSRDDITVYLGSAQAVKDVAWSWVGTIDRSIKFTPAVPMGVTVTVKRSTGVAGLYHKFSGGAQFTSQTLDESLTQTLFVAQEFSESSSVASDDLPLPVGSQASAGKSNKYARTDHVHVGMTGGAVGSVVMDTFAGDGVKLAFALQNTPTTKGATQVFVDSVYQSKQVYSLAANVLTFDEAPATGAVIEVVTVTIGGGKASDIQLNETPEMLATDTGGNVQGALSWLAKFVQTGTGAVSRKLRDKVRERVSVQDFGAKGDGVTDDYPAFQAAINATPALGGVIDVPPGTYYLSAQPTWGTKSMGWMFSTATTFTGPGTGQNKFPSMATNGGQMPVGLYFQSQSRIPYSLANGGVATAQFEMLQPADVVGQSVALYCGARGSNPDPNANVWAINPLIRADAGAGGTYQGIEMDVDCFSDAALVKGISINGAGTSNPDVALELIRTGATKWVTGIDIMNAITAIQVRNTSGLQQGVTVGQPTPQVSVAFSGKQLSTTGDGIVLQRFTDTNPQGYLMRLVDAANSVSLLTIDVMGNFTTQGILQANHLTAKGAASAKPAGSFAIGSTNQQTVGAAGSAAALPATPRGYLIGYDGPTKIVIPYYLG